MSDIADVKLYCTEAQKIIFRSEEICQILELRGACEGHRLIASQLTVALKRLSHIIEKYHNQLAFDATLNNISPPDIIKIHWWSNVRWWARNEDRIFDVGA